MILADKFVATAEETCMCEIDGRWYIAKPEPMPFSWRWKDAWEVLMGRAEAICYKEPTDD